MRAFLFALAAWTCISSGLAQTVEILTAGQILRDPAVTEAQRLIGNVTLGHKDAVLTCDSAWRYDSGDVEVFGNVVMNQPPSTRLTADYLALRPGDEWAQAEGAVVLTHEDVRLQAPSLSYQLDARRARYRSGAQIAEDGWTVTSETGRYSVGSAVMELGGNVRATKQGDTLTSDSLHWMREAERYVFLGRTRWASEGLNFECDRGNVVLAEPQGANGDSERKEPVGWMSGSVVVTDGADEVHGDSLRWDEEVSEVWREVVLRSGNGASEVHGAYALQQKSDSTDLVLGRDEARAWLRQVDNGDTLLLAAVELQRARGILTATRNVTLVQDKLVGVGDSLAWRNAEDGTKDGTGGPGGGDVIRMFGAPELWSDGDRLSGDSLRLFLEDQRPTLLEMRGHARVLSPANDTLAHRIQGRDLDAYFLEGELDRVKVLGNGELTYFELPEGKSGTVRMNRALCAEITLRIENRKLTGIGLNQSPKGSIRPLRNGENLGEFEVGEAPRLGPWETSQQRPLPE
ncbi:MAG: OstA-like protein [Flavobacteriales bacterium]